MSLRQREKPNGINTFPIVSKTSNVQNSQIHIVPVKLDSQPKVRYTAGSILFNKDVFTLQVSMRDGRFSLRAIDLSVQVTEARYGRIGQFQQSADV